MSDLKHRTADELRQEIAGISRWRNQKMAEAVSKEKKAAELIAEAAMLRQRAHNMGQREAWARVYLAQKT
jgi:hypothetical protein